MLNKIFKQKKTICILKLMKILKSIYLLNNYLVGGILIRHRNNKNLEEKLTCCFKLIRNIHYYCPVNSETERRRHFKTSFNFESNLKCAILCRS